MPQNKQTFQELSWPFQYFSSIFPISAFLKYRVVLGVNFSTMGGYSHCCYSVIRDWWQQKHPCYQYFSPGMMYFAICMHTMNKVKAQNQIIFISVYPLQELWLSGVVCAVWVSYLTVKILMPCLAVYFKPITRKPSPVVSFLLLLFSPV